MYVRIIKILAIIIVKDNLVEKILTTNKFLFFCGCVFIINIRIVIFINIRMMMMHFFSWTCHVWPWSWKAKGSAANLLRDSGRINRRNRRWGTWINVEGSTAESEDGEPCRGNGGGSTAETEDGDPCWGTEEITTAETEDGLLLILWCTVVGYFPWARCFHLLSWLPLPLGTIAQNKKICCGYQVTSGGRQHLWKLITPLTWRAP